MKRNDKIIVVIGKAKTGKTSLVKMVNNKNSSNLLAYDIDEMPKTEVVDRALFLAGAAFTRRAKMRILYCTLPCPRFESLVKQLQAHAGVSHSIALYYLPDDYDAILEEIS